MLTKRLVMIIIMLVTLMMSIIALMTYFSYQRFLTTPINISQPQVFTIKPGMSFSVVNNQLSQRRIIDNPNYFEWYVRHTNQAKQLKSGEYRLLPGLTPSTLLATFVAGQVIQYAFTIIEGWQIRTLLTAINANDKLVSVIDNQAQLIDALALKAQNVEGLFFPDTYYFTKGMDATALLQRSYQRLQTVLAEEWQQRAAGLPYQSPYEALIMASIIEKETALASEHKKIAGVFVRRLQKNMKLQTDPTVIYALGEAFDGNIRKQDLKLDSPYNTYRYKGLPPSPIALAGRRAIHAALNPEAGNSLYFVAKGDGSHHFSATLREHNKAVAKYQRNR